MNWICNECGEIFNEPDVRVWSESRGEFWGMPAYERVCEEMCPVCGSKHIEEGWFGDEYEDDEDEEEVEYADDQSD